MALNAWCLTAPPATAANRKTSAPPPPFPGLVLKDSYWRRPKRQLGGTAIDFLVFSDSFDESKHRLTTARRHLVVAAHPCQAQTAPIEKFPGITPSPQTLESGFRTWEKAPGNPIRLPQKPTHFIKICTLTPRLARPQSALQPFPVTRPEKQIPSNPAIIPTVKTFESIGGRIQPGSCQFLPNKPMLTP